MIKWLWEVLGVSVGIGGDSVMKYLWELCWWECGYWCGCCDKMVKLVMLAGM